MVTGIPARLVYRLAVLVSDTAAVIFFRLFVSDSRILQLGVREDLEVSECLRTSLKVLENSAKHINFRIYSGFVLQFDHYLVKRTRLLQSSFADVVGEFCNSRYS